MTTQPAASSAAKATASPEAAVEPAAPVAEIATPIPAESTQPSEPVDQTAPMIAEVESEKTAGAEPDGVPKHAVKFILGEHTLWAKPVAEWRMSSMRLLEAAIYHHFADSVLLPASLALFNKIDPTFVEAKAMIDDWERVTAVEVKKLLDSASS